MPNWVKQRIVFDSTDDLNKVIKAIKPSIIKEGEPDVFSFDWLIPQPKTIEECPAEFLLNPPTEEEFLDWYNWRNTYWGTKWDACEPYIEDNTIWFDTAWSPAEPIYSAIQDKFPDIHFIAEFAEEQGAFFCGEFDSDSGYSVFSDYSDEAYEMFNTIWGDTFEKLEDGEWHSDCDDDVFLDSTYQMHHFDVSNPDKNLAQEFYKNYGDSFIEFLLNHDDSQDFLRSILGESIIG